MSANSWYAVKAVLSANIDSLVYHNHVCQENQHIHAAMGISLEICSRISIDS